MASPGTDIAFNVARTEGYRAFANKIWNAARFIFMNVDRAAEIGIKVDRSTLGEMPLIPADAPLEDRWIVAELHAAAGRVNQSLANYRFDDAANNTYQFFWGSFCDWYLEIVKSRLDFSVTADNAKIETALNTVVSIFECALRLLSPFMPFITEELWHVVHDNKPPTKSIALSKYPTESVSGVDRRAINAMILLQDLVGVAREERKNREISEREFVPMSVIESSNRDFGINPNELIKQNADTIKRLARISSISFNERLEVGNATLKWRSVGFTEIALVHEKEIDVAAERERLTKEIAKLEKNVVSAERQLENESFLSKAPAHIVEGLKKQLEENRLLRKKAQEALDGLPPESDGEKPPEPGDEKPPEADMPE